MMCENLNLLSLTVSSVYNDTIAQPVDETPKKVFWIIFLIFVILICTLGAKYMPEISNSIRIKKKENEQKKYEKSRQEELERLHEIKRKNKRK